LELRSCGSWQRDSRCDDDPTQWYPTQLQHDAPPHHITIALCQKSPESGSKKRGIR
jgi:hypothetical protein